jgi:hypothetical protein
MKTVWKYMIPFHSDGKFELEYPILGQIVKIDMQDGVPWMWIFIDTDLEVVKRKFEIYGTGHSIEDGRVYRGTFFQNMFVWHVFEVFE